MLSAFASGEVHRRAVAQQSRTARGSAARERAGARCDAQRHSGIHARPSKPVTMNAARHPLRTAIHVATGGASTMPEADGDLIQRRCPTRARRASGSGGSPCPRPECRRLGESQHGAAPASPPRPRLKPVAIPAHDHKPTASAAPRDRGRCGPPAFRRMARSACR